MAAIMIMLCFSGPALASGGDKVILSDRASLLKGTQTTALITRAQELAKQTGWDIRLVTTKHAGGKTAEEYAEDFYMDHYRQNNGLVYLIDMDNRELQIATSGDAIYYLTDERIEMILDTAVEYVSNEAYADAFRTMMNMTSTYYSEGIDPHTYMFDRDTGQIVPYKPKKKVTLMEGLLAALAALLGGGAFGGSVAARYRMKSGKYRYNPNGNSSVQLTGRTDELLREYITTRNLPKNPPSSGRSSGGHRSTVHSGSHGHSFGGGGRKF